ncbi:diacylglycerol/lipid kinase family protein [Alkanindiges illinoisensis]|uniref:Diacylglycerol kinase n=1 Tax=Alkanindiges illinoisensis TaxID=197183 RepID=A0A4Y7XF24_9GAMM|nr:diacylglycerol kinase family protein [Alkanindiges illinoisensis]TEU30421.1 diacylglycerol kinase [Alkanindiges illinoisensis]
MSSSPIQSTELSEPIAPVSSYSPEDQPAYASGRLISMVMNTGSGHHAYGHEQLARQLTAYFSEQGFEVDLYLLTEARQLSEVVRQARAKHEREGGVIVAAGGDGTLNTVAQELKHSSIRMGIIPLGTFNYVARALDIPLDPFAAAQVIVEGIARPVHLGIVNDYIYLNNASIGLYPKIIEQRELYNARFGRFRVVAMVSGFVVLMREQQKLKLKMTIDGEQTPIETPLVFFGNNQLQLQDLKLTLAECVAQGKLAAVAITALTRWQMIKLIHRLQVGLFEQAPEVTSFCADQIKIESRVKRMKVAIDGEIVQISTPLIFKVAHNALQVMVPQGVTK